MHDVKLENWQKFTLFEQLGNIGSEVGRSIKAFKNNDERAFNGALCRALDLFEMTAKCNVEKYPHRVKEILRAKEEYLRLFYDDNFDDAEAIERYFMNYAFAARYEAGK